MYASYVSPFYSFKNGDTYRDGTCPPPGPAALRRISTYSDMAMSIQNLSPSSRYFWTAARAMSFVYLVK